MSNEQELEAMQRKLLSFLRNELPADPTHLDAVNLTDRLKGLGWTPPWKQVPDGLPVEVSLSIATFLCPVHRITTCTPMSNSCGIINAMKNHLQPIAAMLSDADNAVCLEWIEHVDHYKSTGPKEAHPMEHPAGRGHVCGEPADFIVWGHLYEKEQKGPKCSIHFHQRMPGVFDWAISQNAIYDLRPLRSVIGKVAPN